MKKYTVLLLNGSKEIEKNIEKYFNLITIDHNTDLNDFYENNYFLIDLIIDDSKNTIKLFIDDNNYLYYSDINDKIEEIEKRLEEYDFSKHVALSMLDNNERIYNKLLQRYYEEYKNSESVIRQYMIEGQNNNLKMYIHKIKGISMNLGSQKLYIVSKIFNEKIENMLLSNDEVEYFISFHNRILKIMYDEIK